MGKRGPRPETRTLSIAKGSWRAKKKPNEPDEVSGDMLKPDWLGALASAKWDELIPIMRGRGTYSPAYVDFLAAFCQAYEDMRDAMGIIERDGPICTGERGSPYMHPAVSMKYNAIDRMAKFGREFGLSPTSIRDIQAAPVKPENSKGRFFGKQA